MTVIMAMMIKMILTTAWVKFLIEVMMMLKKIVTLLFLLLLLIMTIFLDLGRDMQISPNPVFFSRTFSSQSGVVYLTIKM